MILEAINMVGVIWFSWTPYSDNNYVILGQADAGDNEAKLNGETCPWVGSN